MPRTARASRGGVCYHVINRGNGREAVFHKAADYRRFTEMMGEACERLSLRVTGWCLSDTVEPAKRRKWLLFFSDKVECPLYFSVPFISPFLFGLAEDY